MRVANSNKDIEKLEKSDRSDEFKKIPIEAHPTQSLGVLQKPVETRQSQIKVDSSADSLVNKQ
jgi:hypothetical protein